jgi:ABC-2 type transport system permease protein
MVVEGLKRSAPGFIKTVALWAPKPEQMPPQMPGMPPQQPQAPQSFRELGEKLRGSYQVVPADLSSGSVPDEAEVLLLAGPSSLSDTEQRAIDQFLMRGGAVIVLAGRYRLDLSAPSLQLSPVATGLEKLLAAWGVEVAERLVLDSRNDVFPIPVERDLGGGVVTRQFQLLPYPFFVHVPGEAMGDNVMTSQLQAAVLHFASPITARTLPVKAADPKAADAKKDANEPAPAPHKVEVLLSSSENAWLQKSTQIQPNFQLYKGGFGRPSKPEDAQKAPYPLAVAVTGSFESAFAKDAVPEAKKDENKPADKKGSERLIRRSPPDARLVVVGSSSFVADELQEVSKQAGAKYVENNLQLVQNMVDWAVADTDLLSIRSRSSANRLLEVTADQSRKWEFINYGIVVLGLGLVVASSMLRRRAIVPIELDPKKGEPPAPAGAESEKEERP